MDVSGLKGWKPATLPRTRVMLEIISAFDFTSANPDDSGAYTTGTKFRLRVTGPGSALLDNGEPAMGYQFDDALIAPKPTSTAKAKDFLNGRLHQRIVACFGEDFPENIVAADWVGRQFWADVRKKFDTYKGEDVPEIVKAYPLSKFGAPSEDDED